MLVTNKSDKLMSNAEREKLGMLAGTVGILINGLIFAIELFVGTISNSVAVTADAFHNLIDVVSSVIAILSFIFASKPADRKHPFGHGRIEYLSALAVAMIVVLIGLEFLKTSAVKVFHPTPVKFSVIALVLVLMAIPLKVLLSLFNGKISKRINSSTLAATSFDAMSDVLILLAASLSLVMAAFTNLHVDGIIGVLVAAFIIFSGVRMAGKELSTLLGEAPDPELVKKIKGGMMQTKYVSGVHDLIIHNYGPGKFMATIHAEVPSEVPSLQIHEAVDAAEQKLMKELGIILVVHVDPINSSDEVVKKAKDTVLRAIKQMNDIKSIHDLRVVGAGSRLNVIFDVVVDSNLIFSKNDENDLRERINIAVKSIEPRYNTVVNIDMDYLSM